MENKYFTPDIEDLCIGYECEYNFAKAYTDEFDFVKIDYKDITSGEAGYTNELTDMIHLIDDGAAAIRVPYLTKEQIEAEGWKYLSEGYVEQQAFYKDDFQMSCFYDKHLLKIIKKESLKTVILYQGSCKCINDFRKIIKLLGI